MFTFKDYLTEAKVSKRNLDKVADIFKRMLEKRFSAKLYRFGGPRGFTEIKDGVGILYIHSKNKAVRLNYIKGEIQSITLWKQFRLGAKGDMTIDLNGLGLLEAGKKLIDIIENPRTGVIKTYGMSESYLAEATRIAPADFAKLVSDNLPPSMSLDSVPWSTITDIALANDYQVPTVVRKETKVPGTKGKNSRFDLEKLLSDDEISTDVNKPARESEPIYFIKITPQDPNTKKFMSVKGDKRAEEILKRMKSVVENPDVSKEMKHPDSLFGILRNLVQVVARGARNSLVVYGGPGTGKTFTVEQTLRDEGLAENQDWFGVSGKITTASLYQKLFMHRKGEILVFDDTDDVWKNDDAANILKAALDSYDKRKISWYSTRTVNVGKMSEEDREVMNDEIDIKLATDPGSNIKFPSEFDFEGKIIFISNLKYDDFDSAVLSRAAKIDMTLTDEQMFIRMKSILEHLGDKSVPLDAKEEILEFLMQQTASNLMRSPTMRTYVAAEDLYRSGIPNWKELLEYV